MEALDELIYGWQDKFNGKVTLGLVDQDIMIE